MLTSVIAHQFDFQKKINYNVEFLKSKAARLASYGVTIDDTHLVLITLANIEVAAHEDYGSEFRIAMQAIRRKYDFNVKHDATSFEYILKELASADGVRKLKDAPEPSTHQANAVEDRVSYLTKLMQETVMDDDSSHYTGYETANAATSDSESSRETVRRDRYKRKDRKKDKEKKQEDRGKSKDRRRKNYKDNPCKHCRKFKRANVHPPGVGEDRCFWNKDYKGYRQKWVCEEMEMKYIPKHKFTAAMGGYSESEGEDE